MASGAFVRGVRKLADFILSGAREGNVGTDPGLAQASLALDPATFFWALRAMCEIHRRPFSAELVQREVLPPYTLGSLREAAAKLGLCCGLVAASPSQLPGKLVPCLALVNPVGRADDDKAGDDAAAVQIPTHSFKLLIAGDAEKLLMMAPGRAAPEQLTTVEFAAGYAGFLLLFGPEGQGHKIDDPDAREKRSFGFRWFIPELIKHKAVWRDVLIASLVLQLMSLATPLFTQVVIDKVVVHHTANTLIVIGIALIIFMLATAALSWTRQYLVLHTGNRIDAVLGSAVFDHLLRLPPRYFEQRATGILVARLHGVETIRDFITGAAVTLVLDFPFLLIFLAIMFYYSVTLSLIAMGILTCLVVLSIVVTPTFRDRLNHQFLVGARNQAFTTEYVSGIDTVKALQLEPLLAARYGEYLAAYLEATFRTKSVANTYNTLSNMLEGLLTLLVLCVGAWLVMTTQSMTIGMLVAFQMFSGRLAQPMLRMAGLWTEFQQARIAVERLGDVLDAPKEPWSLTPAREPKREGRLSLEALGFRYHDKQPLLFKNLTAEIPAGQCIAILGPSGCGKSTLAKLLLGYYVPTEGRLLLDGHDLAQLPINVLRSYFGVVPQETMLFKGTVYDNVAMANPLAAFEQVVQACKLAEIHDAIEKLPEGYQTELGEHGVGLSGGQKQRIAIARALIRRPRILIFDEATSSLDQETASHIAATVTRLKGQVTILFITHQLPKELAIDATIRLGGGGAVGPPKLHPV